jgi:hypothetical protein
MAHVSAQALITRAGVTRRTACVSSLVEPRYSVRHAEMCAAVCLHAHTQSHSVMRCKGQLTLLAHNCAACISARMIWRRMTDQHRTTRLAARVPPLVCACTESTPQLPGGLYALRCVLGAVLCSQGRVRPACCAAGRCGAEHRRAAHRRLKTKWSLLECRCMLPDFPDLIDPCHLPACPCAHHACLSCPALGQHSDATSPLMRQTTNLAQACKVTDMQVPAAWSPHAQEQRPGLD